MPLLRRQRSPEAPPSGAKMQEIVQLPVENVIRIIKAHSS